MPRALHPLNVLSTQIVIPDNFLFRPSSCFNLPFVQFFTPLFSSSGNILMSLGSLKIRKCLPFLPSPVEEDCDLYRALQQYDPPLTCLLCQLSSCFTSALFTCVSPSSLLHFYFSSQRFLKIWFWTPAAPTVHFRVVMMND